MSNGLDQIVLVHISDLHFTQTIVNNTFFFQDLAGRHAHDFNLCRAFLIALSEVRVICDLGDGEPIYVAVTGDITSAGAATEFPVVHSFIRSRWLLRREPPRQDLGLAMSNDYLAAVPGNHDHWNGAMFFNAQAYSTEILPAHFRPTPWRKKWTSPGGKLLLEIYGIDSNSGMALLPRNARARGAFSPDEVTQLEELLRTSDKESVPAGVAHRIRILLTHHSPSFTAYNPPFNFMELDFASKQALLDLAATYRIITILTGHTHDFGRVPLVGPSGGPPKWTFTEFRSAATLCGPASRQSSQGFWVHRISLSSAGPMWHPSRFGWTGDRFVRQAHVRDPEFRIP